MNSPGMALASLLISLRDHMDDYSKIAVVAMATVAIVTVTIMYIWTEVLF